MDEENEIPQGKYVKYGDLNIDQKNEASLLLPPWSEEVLFWVENGSVYKDSMTAKKKRNDENKYHLC